MNLVLETLRFPGKQTRLEIKKAVPICKWWEILGDLPRHVKHRQTEMAKEEEI